MSHYTARRSLLLFAIIILAGCGGGTRHDAPPAGGPDSAQAPLILAGLPPLPEGRAASATEETEISGSNTCDRSANAINDGNSLELVSGSDALSWGIWRIHQPLLFITGIEVVLDVPAGEEAWIALSDYSRGTWDLEGPVTAGRTLVPDEARHRSEQGDLYLAVVAHEGDIPTVHKLVLTTDNGWTIVTVDGAEDVGGHCSLAVIGGHPAISYYLEDQGDLKYAWSGTVRGGDAADWTTTFVDSGAVDVGKFTSLAIVQSQPAISYYDVSNGALRYARRNATLPPDPPTWSRVIVDTDDYGTDVGKYSSLAVVDGRPLISYYDYSNHDLRHAVSMTTTGTDASDWVTYVTDGDDEVGKCCSLAVVDGSAAVSYYDTSEERLKYKRFGDPATVTVHVIEECWEPITSLAVVAGAPAIAYPSNSTSGLVYSRSSTPHGSDAGDWTHRGIDPGAEVGWGASLAVVDGRPAIAYRYVDYYGPGSSLLMFAWSSGPTGMNWEDWGKVLVDGGEDECTGHSASLAEVDGLPAIAYHDANAGQLKYAIRLGP